MHELIYIAALFVHVVTACLWIGAMFFGDPQSSRFFSKLFERRLKGIGWYAQASLWMTGLYLLHHRGLAPWHLLRASSPAGMSEIIAGVKMLILACMAGLQIYIGNRPSRWLYAYILGALAAVFLGILLARPALTG